VGSWCGGVGSWCGGGLEEWVPDVEEDYRARGVSVPLLYPNPTKSQLSI
jgi:hypothetical protein